MLERSERRTLDMRATPLVAGKACLGRRERPLKHARRTCERAYRRRRERCAGGYGVEILTSSNSAIVFGP